MSDSNLRKCLHVGCRVYIQRVAQPRRYALGLCRAHEAEVAVIARQSNRPDVRVASVATDPGYSSGVGAVSLVSLPREPWA